MRSSRAGVDVRRSSPGLDRRRQVEDSEKERLSYTVNYYNEDENQDFAYLSDTVSDYDLDAFGPVDVDPTLTESEWLRSQGIDPDDMDNFDQSNEPVAVLSLAEVSYSRDIQSVNKAERERHIRAANSLWGAQAVTKRSNHPPRLDFRGSKRPGRGRGKGGRPPPTKARNPTLQGAKPSPMQYHTPSSSPPTFLRKPPAMPPKVVENPTLRPNARVFVPMTVSIDGMNPNAPAFIPGYGFKS
jgi:hypothetical protein